MATVRVAAVQASYVLMDQQATLDKVAELTGKAAGQGAQLVAFPEVFIPGTPIWIDTRPVWDGDEAWFRLLAENAVTVPGPATERLADLARDHGIWLVAGIEERERHGGTIYNTVLYFSPDGALAGRHRKLIPTGAERTVWGMGDGSTLTVADTEFGRVGGLICWENYMPLARFHLYAQGVDLWVAPTLALGDGWIATMRHIARENRMFVIGVNPVLHIDHIPAGFRTGPARPGAVPQPERGVDRGRQHRHRRAQRADPGRARAATRGNPDCRPGSRRGTGRPPPARPRWPLPSPGRLPPPGRHLTPPRSSDAPGWRRTSRPSDHDHC